jgi:hypothetical protein
VIIDISFDRPEQPGTFTVNPRDPASVDITVTEGTRKWVAQSGSLVLNSDRLSGTIDADLISSTNDRSSLHVSGKWACLGKGKKSSTD